MALVERVTLALLLAFAVAKCAGDLMVQLNVNRPFNDVNEKFVSFAVKPEDLYKALDGPNRKTVTRMAAMLGESFIKFTGDYYFSVKSPVKLRKPTRIIWMGFNRWTRAMNWSMIIPVPYKPNNWDAVPVLKILNSSQIMGITDCIWQLGTEFGSSRAKNYVTELKTFNLMVESFGPYVDDWQVMGADVASGSSADETRRYVDLSKDINTAFGWSESPNMGNNININENDPALKVLLASKVPVWYSAPQKRASRSPTSKINGRFSVEEAMNGLNWAHVMGEAASTGFDVVFKPLSLHELENPSFDFYVTALFKKVMGSRVFPARPLNIFSRTNKLYTHCANAVSGGIAFMVVNPGESNMQISLRSVAKMTANEVWQYTLWYKNGFAMLNEEKLSLNSTLSPQIRVKSINKPVLLSTPGMSVSFWVLPNVNLDHCQYIEVEADDAKKKTPEESSSPKQYSSSDKLLQTLIQENSMVHGALSRAINRRRRYATLSERPRSLILENLSENTEKFVRLLRAILMDTTSIRKREADSEESSTRGNIGILQWLRSIIESINLEDLPLLKGRNKRSIGDNYFGPYFATPDGKKTGITRKITEIKKPERKSKPLFDQKDFDEEEFFKKMGDQDEREFRRFPDGDIHLKHITNAEGDVVDDIVEEKKSPSKKPVYRSKKPQEPVNEMRPLRLLPTEFYEMPSLKPTPNKMPAFGSVLNNLFFPDPFSKKSAKKVNEEPAADTEDAKKSQGDQLRDEFRRSQKLLSGSFLNEQRSDGVYGQNEDDLDGGDRLRFNKPKYYEDFDQKNDNYFGDGDDAGDREKRHRSEDLSHVNGGMGQAPWWQANERRHRRSVQLEIPEDAWLSNAISKDEEITPLGDTPVRFVYKVESPAPSDPKKNEPISKLLVATVKRKVSSFVDIVTRHFSEWYNTLSKHLEVNVEESRELPHGIMG